MFCEEICWKFEGENWTWTVAKSNEAKLDWCQHEQSFIVKEKHFEKQKLALNLCYDEKGFYRLNQKANPGKLKYCQEYPILSRSNSCFTRFLILQCHEDVHHCDLENTLNRVCNIACRILCTLIQNIVNKRIYD